ncbi:MAG: hypothetical protein ACYTG4_08505, partial [Planctomycetota bacterium]
SILADRKGDRDVRRKTMKTVSERSRAAILRPHAEALAAMEKSDRADREGALYQEALWQAMQPDLQKLHLRMQKSLENPDKVARDGRRRSRDEHFEKWFGVKASDLGVDWAPRALMRAVKSMPAKRREKVMAKIGRKLEAITALPEERREKAFADLLRGLSRDGDGNGDYPFKRRRKSR